MATKFGRKNPWPKIIHSWGQRSCRVRWGQPEVKFLRNALWPPNLLERTPDQSMIHWWGQRSCRGQSEVKLLGNAIWLLNLVGRIPNQSTMHYWGQRSCKGQPKSTRGQIARKSLMATKFGNKNPWPECNTSLGLKVIQGNKGSTRGQLLRNA